MSKQGSDRHCRETLEGEERNVWEQHQYWYSYLMIQELSDIYKCTKGWCLQPTEIETIHKTKNWTIMAGLLFNVAHRAPSCKVWAVCGVLVALNSHLAGLSLWVINLKLSYLKLMVKGVLTISKAPDPADNRQAKYLLISVSLKLSARTSGSGPRL